MQIGSSTGATVRTIELVFVFEDGVTKAVPVEWSRGITVLDALKGASKKPHGIRFDADGEGRFAFFTEIDGQVNDANGSWMYWVNGVYATVGCGEHILKPGDVVRWEFVLCSPNAG